MATISIEAQISTEQLVHAAAQLPPQELASLVARLLDLQSRNPMPETQQGDKGSASDQDQDVEALASRVRSSRKRILGLNQGSIITTPDFDDPLPDEFWLGDV